MRMWNSIKFRLPFVMVMLLIVPLTIITFVAYQKSEVLKFAVVQKETYEDISPKFQDIFTEYETALLTIGSSPELQYDTYAFTNTTGNQYSHLPDGNNPVQSEFYESFLAPFQQELPYALNVYMGTEDGALYLSELPPEDVDLSGYDPRERDWYTGAKDVAGQVFWTEPYRDTLTGFSTITLAKTVQNESGQVIGVIGIDFNMYELAVMLQSELVLTIIVVLVAALVIGLFIVYFFVKSFVPKISQLKDSMKRLAEGDLTVEQVNVKNKDEIGELLNSYNHMVLNLKTLIVSVIDTSDQVAAASEELSANAEETSRASEQISSSIYEVSTGADEQMDKVMGSVQLVQKINQDVAHIKERSIEVVDASSDASQKSSQGEMVILKVVDQMKNIHKNTEQTSTLINVLHERSKEIQSILTLINEIADQTNLLALNAAIEAARAGDHGKGFAVVADEVRKLAEQSSRSTNQISELIVDIQKHTLESVESMSVGTSSVQTGITLVDTAGQSFKEISGVIKDVSDRMNEVALSIENVNTGTANLVESMDSVQQITEKTSSFSQDVAAATEQQTASTEEVSAATKTLAALAQELQDIAGRFKI